jgi:GT2 family glycosyltransferase/glycosyltransferase involved in cell wall biosynthesis
MRTTRVSVVLVNFRGADDTIEAIHRLREIDAPADSVEIVVVDNASGDDSVERLREIPGIRLIESVVNSGFAGGCNTGAAASTGEIIAFLNNDAKPDPSWISAALAAFDESPRIGAVASRVLDWEGVLVDYIGSGMTWFGMGYKPFTSEPPPAHVPTSRADVLFGTGSAMFVRREVYEQLGGFDERFFMFFEDVDFGWRLNLLGYRFVYEPKSLAYHRHHASMVGFGDFKEQYLLERNALYSIYKNFESSTLVDNLPAALALAVRRSIDKGRLDSEQLDLRRPGGDDVLEMPVPKITMAGVFAIDQFVQQLPGLRADRAIVQATRVRSDASIWPLFGFTDMPAFESDRYSDGYENIVEAFEVVEAPVTSRVLVITGDPIGRRLAGPAIRAWNMALEIVRHAEVRLVSLSGVEEGLEAPFPMHHVAPGDEGGMRPHEDWADVIVFQGHAMAVFDTIRDSRKLIVADVYDPMHLEQLEQGRSLGEIDWARQVREATDTLNEQLERADFVLCASERQRSFWLGQLAALGRINPATYAGDPDLEHLIAVAPFGLPAATPTHDRAVLKGVHPGIGLDDKLLIWGGGLYDWFDPESLIRAVAELSLTRPQVRLYFLGTAHPHPGVPEMPIVARSRELAEELGVLDSAVFFNDAWVEYADRHNYLTEADAGVSTHYAHVETRYSFRTRILDYLWAELPMVVTRGDHFGDLVEREQLGVAVGPEDVAGLVAGLERVLFDDEFAERARVNIRRVREAYRWDRALRPLLSFVASPRPAGDRGDASMASAGLGRRPRRRRSGFRHDLRLALYYFRMGGAGLVADRVRRRMERRRR